MCIDPLYQTVVHHQHLGFATDLWVNGNGKHEALVLFVAVRELLLPEPLYVVRVDEAS